MYDEFIRDLHSRGGRMYMREDDPTVYISFPDVYAAMENSDFVYNNEPFDVITPVRVYSESVTSVMKYLKEVYSDDDSNTRS